MNANSQRLSDAHEDERIRYVRAQKVASLEREVRELKARLVRPGERSDCEVRSDDTGFTPGARGLL